MAFVDDVEQDVGGKGWDCLKPDPDSDQDNGGTAIERLADRSDHA